MTRKALYAWGIMITVSSVNGSAPMRDDGITEPYEPPEEQTAYLAALPEEVAAAFHADPDVVEAWQDDRFGVFMHWDPSSQVTGSTSWSRWGRRPHHGSDGKVTRGIPAEVYDAQYKTFNPVKFDADAYAQMIKAAGARYFVFTAKHHQGFAMFASEATDYHIMATPFARDICKELAEACQRHGIKILWYYSQPDWYDERYAAPYPSEEFDRYVDEVLHPHLIELASNYGPIDGIWFDGLGKHPDKWRAHEIIPKLRALQPNLIFNHRFGPRHWRMGDFDGPENELGRFQTNRPWETCARLGGGWGYSGDSRPMSFSDAMGLLVRCAGNGGNLLLNTGPAPDGSINPRHVERYLQMGAWLKQYGESIYATRAGPYMPGPWGCATRSKDGNTVYLHVLGKWSGALTLPDLPAKIIDSRVLTGGAAIIEQGNGRLRITLTNVDKAAPATIVHEFDTVIALELDRPAMSLPVLSSTGPSLTVGGTAEASSSGAMRDGVTSPDAVIATDATEFDDGNHIRAEWRPDGKDKDPWLAVHFAEPTAIDQIGITEGRYGFPSRSESFAVSLRINGKWQTVHEGEEIGSMFGLVLPETVVAEAVRVELKKWNGPVTLNAVNAYQTSSP